jgi:sugar/nucleoside kinase (ribokinase family)
MIDYLAVGHITQDIVAGERVTGGTVAFSGCTAVALGCQTAVLSSAAPDFDWVANLPDIQCRVVPAAETTTFQNIYTENGRLQYLHGRAHQLTAADVPPAWQQSAIVHLGPVADELEPAMVNLFPNSLIGLTPQGWLRQWDKNGRITPKLWAAAEQILPLATAVVLSEEDIPTPNLLTHYRTLTPLLVLTKGAKGCVVYTPDQSHHIPAPAVTEVEATGAGDIFATAFFIKLWQTNNPYQAATFANKLAAQSVTQRGLTAKIRVIKTL